MYRARINPITHFDEYDFLCRYRLSKEVVLGLTRRFENSPYLSTYGDGRGSVISPEERVSTVMGQ